MSKNKLQKFSELSTFPNTYQNYNVKEPVLTDYEGKEQDLKGKWKSYHFKNGNPITLELACGGGEYTVGLAKAFPLRNFIGIDIKGARIWKGAKKALKQKLVNAAFLRTRIEKITSFFEPGEIDEIWITFPDPFLKKSKANRRLTAPTFLKYYRQILKPDGVVHLKTDSPELYAFTLEVIQNEKLPLLSRNENIYAGELPVPELELKTFYEHMHLEQGKTIKYIQFLLNPSNESLT